MGEGFRRQLAKLAAVVGGELTQVPEAPAVGDDRYLDARLRAPEIAPHAAQPHRLQVLLRTDTELLAESVAQSPLHSRVESAIR